MGMTIVTQLSKTIYNSQLGRSGSQVMQVLNCQGIFPPNDGLEWEEHWTLRPTQEMGYR